MHNYRNLSIVMVKYQIFYCNAIVIYCRGLNAMLYFFLGTWFKSRYLEALSGEIKLVLCWLILRSVRIVKAIPKDLMIVLNEA